METVIRWKKQEPVTLPVKFPLLLAQGVEGIAVGLASKLFHIILMNLLMLQLLILKNKDFELFPDFPTGGMADFSKYNDGLRGGTVKVRAKIEKRDNKTFGISLKFLMEKQPQAYRIDNKSQRKGKNKN